MKEDIVHKISREISQILKEIAEASDDTPAKADAKKDSSKKGGPKKDNDAEKKSADDKKGAPLEKPEAPPTSGKDIFSGGGEGGPDVGASPGSGIDAGSPGPSGEEGEEGGEEGEEDEKSKISYYTDQLNNLEPIENARQEREPGFDFSKLSDAIIRYFDKNYIGLTPGGTIIIAVPATNSISFNAKDSGVNFISKYVLPKIDGVIKKALSERKRIVLLGNSGLPFYEGNYEQDENGLIARYLNKKYPKYIIYDTWAPSEYEAFVGHDEIWQELKQITQAENVDIKSAIYLYLSVTGKTESALKVFGEDVENKLSEWGITNPKDVKQIYAMAYPETADHPQNAASFIIKTYLNLLQKNMVKKIQDCESKGNVAIVISDLNTAWSLSPAFKSLGASQKEKTPEKQPEKPKEQPKQPEGGGANEKQPK